jgi:hypothetical protein
MRNLTKHGKHVNKRKREVDREGWFNPFLVFKNKRLFISSEGFSTLEKNGLICYQRAMLPIQSGVTALCRY